MVLEQSKNPFISSSEVYLEDDFFDREEVLNAISGFINKKNNYNFLLYGQRRMGKTSVLKKIQKIFDNNTDVIAIYYSLQGDEEIPLDELLIKISEIIATNINYQLNYSITQKTFITKFLADIKKALGNKQLVLLFDEFDVLGERENIDALKQKISFHKFIPYITEIIENVKNNDIPLKMLFAIGRNYKDLDTNRFAQINKFGQQIEISTFPKEIVLKILSQSDNIIPFSNNAKEKIWEITGGQPYFIQCLAHICFDTAEEQKLSEVNPQLVEQCLPTTIKRYSSGVIWIWDTLKPKDKIILYILAVLKENNKKLTKENIISKADELHFLPATENLEQSLSLLTNIKFLKYAHEYNFEIEFFRHWIITEISVQNLNKYISEFNE